MILINALMSHKCRCFSLSDTVRAGTSTARISINWRGGRAPNRVLGAPGTDANNHVDAADFGTGGRHPQGGHPQNPPRDVLLLSRHLAEKKVGGGRGCGEIRTARARGHLLPGAPNR